MKPLSLVAHYSDVKRMVYTVTLTTLMTLALLTQFAWAADEPAADNKGINIVNKTEAAIDCGIGRRNKTASECEDDPNYKIAECKTKEDALKVDQKAMTSACSKAGLSSNCSTTIQKCMDAAATEGLDQNLLQQALPMLQQALGSGSTSMMNLGTNNTGCANKSERDYKDEKERIEREIVSAQKDLDAIIKKIPETKKKLNDEMKEAQEGIAEAKKAMEEQKVKLDAEQRESLEKLSAQTAETNENIRKMNTAILDKRAEITRQERAFSDRLLKMTKGLNTLQCLAQVKKEKAEMEKAGLFNRSSTTGNYVANGNKKRAALQEMFDTCMSQFDSDRQKLFEERRAYLNSAQNSLNNMQTTMDELNQQLSSHTTSMQTTIKEIGAQKTVAENQVVEKMQNATAALQAAQQNNTEELQAIQQEQTTAQARVAQLNADLSKMGPVPTPGATEGWRSAQSAVLDYSMAVSSFCEGECKDISKSTCSAAAKRAADANIKANGNK